MTTLRVMGCKKIRSNDPRVFGPPTWECLHIFAQNYNPSSPRVRKHCKRFLISLSYMLPCRHCGVHFRRYIVQNRVDDAVRTREGLVALLVGAHNAVTVHTRPEQPPYSVACAKRQYLSMSPRNNSPLSQIWIPPNLDSVGSFECNDSTESSDLIANTVSIRIDEPNALYVAHQRLYTNAFDETL